MKHVLQSLSVALLMMSSLSPVSAQESVALSMKQVVELATQSDPWLKGSEFRESALRAQAIVAGELPDPVASVSTLNLPTDGFSLNQEPMTQVKLGLSQVLPRGDSLALKQQKMSTLAARQPALREDRIARLQAEVASVWLDLFLAQQSIALIEQDRNLFEQLGDVASANYASALGRARQQDLIRARLELTRLDDRVTSLNAKRDIASAKLTEWLGDRAFVDLLNVPVGTQILAEGDLPDTAPPSERQQALLAPDALQMLIDFLSTHPSVKAVNELIRAGGLDTALARQLYKPQWKLNAAYAWRDDDALGRSRADFLSFGVSFDLPLFTEQRQDQKVSSAIAQTEAIKTEKRLLLQKLLSGTQQTWASIQRLKERQAVYQYSILQQIHEQAEASLTAYTNDDGDFAEVVRARIDNLNARIDALTIDVELARAGIRLNYYFTGAASASAAAGAY